METEKPLPRIHLHVEVEYKKNYARQASGGVLKNISLSGAFVESRGADFKHNEKIMLTFSVSGRERKIAAHVIWTSQEGAGIKFKPTNNRDVQIIDDLMYFVETSRTGKKDVLDDIFKKVA